jgi:hypothetical protein
MMLPILPTTERELAIWEGDVKMTTLVMLVPLRFERTTPGIARKLMLTASSTVN